MASHVLKISKDEDSTAPLCNSLLPKVLTFGQQKQYGILLTRSPLFVTGAMRIILETTV